MTTYKRLHALTRDYGSRPNTRVKDLVDLLLLIHDGLLPDRDLLAACPALVPRAASSEQDLPSALDTPRAFWARTTSIGATT